MPALLRWFDARRRDLPWRTAPRPYAVWVSEIMLQQTQVATVIPYYRRFMRRFPTVRALARAPLEDVLKAWEGLGYYARARRLKQAAETLVSRGTGTLPTTAAELTAVPGIGPYTAAAIASICFRERVPVVDGNVARVFARFWRLNHPAGSAVLRKHIGARLNAVMDAGRPGDFNQAVMELGALVCRPRTPRCAECPLSACCRASCDGVTDRYPRARRRRPPPARDFSVIVMRRRGRVLLEKRGEDEMLGGLWRFPMCEVDGRAPRKAAARLAARLMGAAAAGPAPVLRGVIRHAYSHFIARWHVFDLDVDTTPAGKKAAHGSKWVFLSCAGAIPCDAATRRVMALYK
jgi:A/G-specific adenine glycosylase